MNCTRLVGKANTGIRDRLHPVAIYDGKEHRPKTIRGSVDRFLIAKFAEIIGLAWLEQGNIRIAGTVQGNIMLLGEMTKELPLWPGRSELNGWASTAAESCVEQFIESNPGPFVNDRSLVVSANSPVISYVCLLLPTSPRPSSRRDPGLHPGTISVPRRMQVKFLRTQYLAGMGFGAIIEALQNRIKKKFGFFSPMMQGAKNGNRMIFCSAIYGSQS